MLTIVEKVKLLNSAPRLSKKLTGHEEADLLIQLLSMYIKKTNASEYVPFHGSNEDQEKCLEEILSYMAEVAAVDEESYKYYTTGELSTYFGVSITTINNWVNEGRFVGVGRRKPHEQLKVSGDVKWKSRSGEVFNVSEIVKGWEDDQKSMGTNLYDFDEKAFLEKRISLYEQKYDGTYELTLGSKEKLLAEEHTDAEAWNYYRRKLGIV